MRSLLITAAALALIGGQAQARDLKASDLKVIEGINQARNRQAGELVRRLPADQGPCTIAATNKAFDLIKAGYGAGELSLAIVLDEHGKPHEVAEVKGTLKGKPVVIVLDNRLNWTLERKDAEAVGYTWIAEFQYAPDVLAMVGG